MNDHGPLRQIPVQASISLSETSLFRRLVRRPVAVTMVALAFLVFGGVSLDKLPVTLMPELNYPSLTVQTSFPSASPTEVEREVSEKIQDAVGNVPDLIAHSSISRFERSDVLLEFAWGTDMLEANARVSEAMERVFLADGIERPQLLRYDPAQDPIMRLMLFATDPRMTPTELREYADEVLKDKLRSAIGVASVRVSGGLKKQILIIPDKKALDRYKLDIDTLRTRVASANVDSSVGLVNVGGREVLLRLTSTWRDIEDIRKLTLVVNDTESGGGEDRTLTLALGDIAEVKLESEEPDTITRYADADDGFRPRDGVLIEILKMGDANIIKTAQNLWAQLYGQYWQQVRDGGAYPDRAERDRIAQERRASGRGDFDRDKAFGMLDQLDRRTGMAVLTDQSVFIESAVGEVRNAVLLGGILAVVVIFLFLRSVWATVLIAISIIVSVVTTFIPMGIAGISMNLMSLGGLALGVGMLVDNSIVVLESITRCREEGDSRIEAAARGTSEVAAAIFASTLTTVAVFFPIVFVEGMAGQIFHEQSLTVVFSLVASLVVALLVIPAYAAMGSDGDSEISFVQRLRATSASVLGFIRYARWPKQRWKWLVFGPFLIFNSAVVVVMWLMVALVSVGLLAVIAGLALVALALKYLGKVTIQPLALLWQGAWLGIDRSYRPMLALAVRNPVLVVGISLGLAGLSVLIAMRLPAELVPALSEDTFNVDVAAPEGTRLELTDGGAVKVVQRLAGIAEFAEATSGVMIETGGSVETTGRTIGPNRVRFVVRLKSVGEEKDRVVAQIHDAITAEDTFDTAPVVTAGTLFTLKSPVVVQVRGLNLPDMIFQAEEIAAVMRKLQREDGKPLLKDVRLSTERGSPQIHIIPDRAKLQRYGLTSEEVSSALSLMLKGDVISDLEDRGEKIDIFLRLDVRYAEDPVERLRALEIFPRRLPGLRLQDILREGEDSLRPTIGPSEIRRTQSDRVVEVTAVPNEVPLGVVRSALGESLASLDLVSEDLRIVQTGQQEEVQQSANSLIFALALAVFLVYVVMAVQFESFIDPLLIMGSLPLASVGVVIMLWLSGTPLSVVVMLGVIVLAGIVVNNAIVLIDYANQLRKRGMTAKDAAQTAAGVRLRPIVITTLTTVLGMLPMTGWLTLPLGGLATMTSDVPVLGAFLDLVAGSGEGAEVRGPLAVTVVVGLSCSTILTLLVIPSLYALVHGREDHKLGGKVEDLPQLTV